ncbi:DUF3152 domain-containing protein [Nocardia farcinica]|nr:DUF3152 domain-containing protein [Nocardia farcinica]MBF6184945.1 DUF3152 domain-containing protein [Nocardia farcinica]MBF6310820.1 DUF3152 domain-containing protein [Nocardia farcinica]MBF6409756.1 DUF3152 domain-containing protein [Nocardia farcinica]MBF6421280.1 DUF3152 domain-containing protein [Nocardia farcinica]
MFVTDRPERPSGGGRDAHRPAGTGTSGSVVSDPVTTAGAASRPGAAARNGRSPSSSTEPWPRTDGPRTDGPHTRDPRTNDPRKDARGREQVQVYDPLGLYQRPDRSHQPLRARWDPTAADEHRRGPRPDRAAKKQSAFGRFVSTYGWRAYALPVLLAVTVLVGVDAVRGGPDGVGGSVVPGFGQLSPPAVGGGVIGAPPGDGKFPTDLPTGALPDGGPFTESGAGTWRVVPGTSPEVGAGTEYHFTYTVEIEDGVDTTGFGGDAAVATMVDSTLANPKSWAHDPKFAFRRIDAGNPDFRISLTSRQTTRTACGFEIPIDSSCYNADLDRVVLSEARWVRGALAFEGDIGSYRQYLINHEVGHAIGYHQHQPCETDGGLAPIMMQQTFGTDNNAIAALDPDGVVPMDGKRCRFNPWPYPRG